MPDQVDNGHLVESLVVLELEMLAKAAVEVYVCLDFINCVLFVMLQ